MHCDNCGEEIDDNAVICVNCGVSTKNFVDNNQSKDSGIYGISSFILSFIALALPIAYLDVLIGIIALVLGIIGIKGDKSKRGLAIAGIVMAVIAIIGAITMIAENPGNIIYEL